MNVSGRLAPGQRFGAYLVDGCVGEGGMGAVYRATDTKLGRVVALKVIRPDLAGGASAEAIARFLRESRVGAALAHPNIVVVFEASAIGDCPYLAMEWVEGASVAALMDLPNALPPAQRIDILESIADALAYAHTQGVIHRDVKPTNVMIDARGRARLVDFGIAKRTNGAGPGTQMLPTHARALLGTPAYMAPEQMLSPAVDARADQFSWGVMAYELLGGIHPNATVPPDGPPFPVAKPTPLTWQRPDVPEALAAVVHRAVSYEPGSRFPSMDEAIRAFRAARSGMSWTPPPYLPAQAPRSDLPTVAHASSTLPGVVAHTPIAPGAPAPRRFPFLAAALVLSSIFLVTGGVGAALVLTGHTPAAAAGAPLAGGPTGGGPRSAILEPLDSLKFAAPPAEVAKAKLALEAKLTACVDARVERELMFSGRIFVAADGRITKAIDLQICREQHPNYYLCTERVNAAAPKKGFPTVPEASFACVERALLSSRLPRVTLDKGEDAATHDFHIDVH
jgi:serine/threonine-protein kinase